MTLVLIAIQVASHGPDAARAAIIAGANRAFVDDLMEDTEGAHKVAMLAQGKVSFGELASWQVALLREAQAIERERVAHAETAILARPNRPRGSVSAFAGGDE